MRLDDLPGGNYFFKTRWAWSHVKINLDNNNTKDRKYFFSLIDILGSGNERVSANAKIAKTVFFAQGYA